MLAWLPHLLLAPLYLVLGTARHELGHALAASYGGVEVLGVWIVPHWRRGLLNVRYWPGDGWNFYFGYTLLGRGWSEVGRAFHLAPFALGAGVALGGLWAAPLAEAAHGWHGWAAMAIICWVGPAVDLAWALFKWLALGKGDLALALGRHDDGS